MSNPKIYYNDDVGSDDIDFFDSTPCHDLTHGQGQGQGQCDKQRLTFEVKLEQGQQWEYLEVVRLEDEQVGELVVASATYNEGQEPIYFGKNRLKFRLLYVKMTIDLIHLAHLTCT